MSILTKKPRRRQRTAARRQKKMTRKLVKQVGKLATAERSLARSANSSMGRDNISKERSSISWAKAPEHPDLGPGDRVTITCTPYVVGRTGDTYNSPSDLLKYTFGTSSLYGKSVAFGPVWTINSATGSATALCAYGSAYSANGASAVNRATSQIQFYNVGAVRSVKVSYSPTCNAITTTGNLAIAPQFTDSNSGYTTGSQLDMKTYSDVASMPGSFRTPVVRAGNFYLKKMVKPELPSSEFFTFDATAAYASLRMLIACDTQLGAGASDNLGELSFEMVIDLYGPQWNAPLPLSASTVSPMELEERERQKIVDAVCARFGKAKLESCDTKEAKIIDDPRKKEEEMLEWERIEGEAQKRIVDQRAYRAAIASAAATQASTSSATTQSAPSQAPNLLGRPKL